jgi:two-component system, cell cycle sensor histidine kinase and response regulator CckA
VNGYDFICTANPQFALASFKEAPDSFDVVITDMNMPVMNGQELAEKILQIRPDIPIYLCSASVEYGDNLVSKKAELLEIIPKPASFDEIESILAEVTPDNS